MPKIPYHVNLNLLSYANPPSAILYPIPWMFGVYQKGREEDVERINPSYLFFWKVVGLAIC